MLSSYIIITILSFIVSLRSIYEETDEIRVKDCLIMLIISLVPFINVLLLIVSFFMLDFWDKIPDILDYKIIKRNDK